MFVQSHSSESLCKLTLHCLLHFYFHTRTSMVVGQNFCCEGGGGIVKTDCNSLLSQDNIFSSMVLLALQKEN